MPLCNQIVKAARNGSDRGTCSRPARHQGRCGNRSCAICGEKTAGYPYCDACRAQYTAEYREAQALSVKQMVAENETLNAACEQLETLLPIVMERIASLPADTPSCELVEIDGIVIRMPLPEFAEV
jgi:hypothetical protein